VHSVVLGGARSLADQRTGIMHRGYTHQSAAANHRARNQSFECQKCRPASDVGTGASSCSLYDCL
jgi:hypothetical protein